jgi:hypothetical protein
MRKVCEGAPRGTDDSTRGRVRSPGLNRHYYDLFLGFRGAVT